MYCNKVVAPLTSNVPRGSLKTDAVVLGKVHMGKTNEARTIRITIRTHKPTALLLHLQEVGDDGGAVNAVATSQRRHRAPAATFRTCGSGSSGTSGRFLGSGGFCRRGAQYFSPLSRRLHPVRAVVEARCQLHGHRHPLMTVPCSELRRHAAPCVRLSVSALVVVVVRTGCSARMSVHTRTRMWWLWWL